MRIQGQLSRMNESDELNVLPTSIIHFKLEKNDSGIKINGIPIKTIPTAEMLVEGL